MSKRILTALLCAVMLFSILPPVSAASSRQAGAVTTQTGSLNVRSSPSAASRVLTALPKGSHITLLNKSGSWWYVEYGKGLYGYCHSDYITPIAGTFATVALSAGSLNVRTGPGTGYSAIDWLTPDEPLVILSATDGWCRILYRGIKTGYASARYLRSNSSITLAVPDYKQTDSRWANITLGASGKTISQIGCATTAIAMLESYRTGSVIYPDAMARQLRYTASGSVYWPAHYTVVTTGDYLPQILKLLQAGKPVLFGAKNNWGGQHWVVITGFRGGSLAPENFTIRDPGSNSRTTLAQFLESYPVFYKFFHY